MQESQAILIELQYLPPISYFALWRNKKEVFIEQHENYQKRSYRNRCYIAGVNGPLRLSIPLTKGKTQQLPITKVTIAYDMPWQKQHWQSIRSAYSNAPFFDHYAAYIQPHYQKQYDTLFAFNKALLEEILPLLQLETKLSYTTAFAKAPPISIYDARNSIHPRRQIDLSVLPHYPQVFEEKLGFLPNLTILDLLFCTGPQSTLILE